MTDALVNEMQEHVNRGVHRLDNFDPEWVSKVKKYKLDMYDPCHNCVLAQLFGGFVPGLEELGVQDPEFFGFSADEISEQYDGNIKDCYKILTKLWTDAIEERQDV